MMQLSWVNGTPLFICEPSWKLFIDHQISYWSVESQIKSTELKKQQKKINCQKFLMIVFDTDYYGTTVVRFKLRSKNISLSILPWMS